jgi:dolichyl-phosphate-mannose-protein mannosyltransferase
MAYGSVISVKSHRVSGGLLHSHPDTYPKEVGPPQQQVTTYAHKDSNNEWRIKKDVGEPNADEDPVEYVKNGDYVRLEHIATKRNMHSHNNKAPITTEHYQVTCYGNNGVGDDNDVWQIQVYEPDVAASDKEGGQIRLLTARFRLIHKHMVCSAVRGEWLEAGRNDQLTTTLAGGATLCCRSARCTKAG